MSLELTRRVMALEEALRGFDKRVVDAVAAVERRVLAAEAKADHVNARIETLAVNNVVDDRQPIVIPPFPKCLLDIGLVPPPEFASKVSARSAR